MEIRLQDTVKLGDKEYLITFEDDFVRLSVGMWSSLSFTKEEWEHFKQKVKGLLAKEEELANILNIAKKPSQNIRTVFFGDYKFSLNELMCLLDDLQDTAPYFNMVLIYDEELKTTLQHNGIIWTSIRGSSCRGNDLDIFDSFYALVEELFFLDKEEYTKRAAEITFNNITFGWS